MKNFGFAAFNFKPIASEWNWSQRKVHSTPLPLSLVLATSSAYGRAVKVTAGCLRPLDGFSVNLSSSTSYCLRMKSTSGIKRWGDRVSPCRTPLVLSNVSVSQKRVFDCCGGTMIQLRHIRDSRFRNTVVLDDERDSPSVHWIDGMR